MIASTGRKMVLVLLGTTLLASVSFGGWKIWSQADAGADTSEQIRQNTANAQSATTTPAIPAADDKPASVNEKPKIEKPAIKQPVPIHVDLVPMKELPTGKKHSKQDELLLSMAQRLHSEAYVTFISQPGAGSRRVEPTMRILPREWKIPEWTSEEITKEQPPQKGQKDLSLIHRLSLNQFSSSNSQEPKVVAIENSAEKKELTWEIHSLDLVGLVVHDTPKVYVSKRLPEMKNLKKTPLRDPDVFESEGLEELVNGKDLYVRGKEGTMRVLGPIRAGKSCLKCHGDAKEGDMLGAFSYTLRVAQYQRGFNGVYNGVIPGQQGQQIPLPPQPE